MISGSRNTPKAKEFFRNSLSPDWKLNNQYIEKRKHLKRKAPFKLILFIIIVGLLLFSSNYFFNFLHNKQTQKEKKSNKDLQLPARRKLLQNRGKHHTALGSLSPSEKAFLDTISWAEGTLKADGYRVLFGGNVIEDLSRHPEKCIPVRLNRKRTCSTAFGRYQIIDINGKNMSFEPENQDLWAINKLQEIGALGKIKQGDIQGAIALSCKVWSSFPCHKNDSAGYYNQPVKSMSDLVNKYKKRLLLYE
jgi:muramidase (phage lysozyme)